MNKIIAREIRSLTATNIAKIKALYDDGRGVTIVYLAHKYGVSTTAITSVLYELDYTK